MTASVDNIQFAKAPIAGCFFSAATTEPSPSDATTALSANFKDLGRVSANGVKMKVDSEEFELEDFTGDTVVQFTKKQKVEFEVTPIELLNIDKLKEEFGADNVTGTTSPTKVAIKLTDLPNKKFVFELRLRNGWKCRAVIECGKLGGSLEFDFASENPVASAWKIAALPDTNGVKVNLYFAAPAAGSNQQTP